MRVLLAVVVSFFVAAGAHAALIRNLGTDPTPVSTPAEVSCNLYRGTVLVVNTPVVTAAGTVKCLFPAISLLLKESYTATYVNALGFEGDPSLPFATGTVGVPTVPHFVP